jgi:ATP phosphoribosyltransferase regulatory subunit HisZ
MLGQRKLFQRRHEAASSPQDDQRDLRQIFQDQNQLVALDSSIADSKEALRKGRGAVGRALLGTSEEQHGDANAVSLLEAGRHGLLQQVTATTDVSRAIPLNPGTARLLADELHAQLVSLTSSMPKDRLASKSLEIQIQTALRAYTNAIQRLLVPLTFR